VVQYPNIRRIISLGIIFGGVLFFAKATFAATYYIDYLSGNDSNSGLSKSVPWQRHPYMQGFGGSYIHQAGDQFLFKGEVAWPSATLPLRICGVGGTGGNYDYYGVDKGWYLGSTWTRPVLDGENKTLAGIQRIISLEYGSFPPLWGTNPSYIIFDAFEIKGLVIDTNDSFGLGSITAINSDYITIRNCYVHGWYIGPNAVPDNQFGGIVFHAWDPYTINNNAVEDTEVSGADCNKHGGVVIYRANTIRNWSVHDVPNLVLAGCNLIGSHVYNSPDAYDPASHENSIYLWGSRPGQTCYAYNNVIDGYSSVEPFYLGMWGDSSTLYVYNNILNNAGNFKTPVEIDQEGAPTTNSIRLYFYNNVMISNNDGTCMRMGQRTGNGPLNTVVLQNNHCIGTSNVSWEVNPPNKVESNNLVQTSAVASGEGYTSGNLWKPTKASGSTVDAGLNLSNVFNTDKDGVSRPQGSGWDIGAYEYVPGGDTTPPAPPSGLAVYSLVGTSQYKWQPRKPADK